MARSRPLARVYSDHSLAEGQTVRIDSAKAHHLRNVLRAKPGEHVRMFNDRDGEWQVKLVDSGARNIVAGTCQVQIAAADILPDVWLLFAPLKKVRIDYVVEKATEIGVSRLMPVTTQYTMASRISVGRLTSLAISSTEQCGGITVPCIQPLQKLESVLENWPGDRILCYCDETMLAWPNEIPGYQRDGKYAVLVGPEGGFSPRERQYLRGLEFVVPFALGPRIMRAETAAVVALTLLHSSGSRAA